MQYCVIYITAPNENEAHRIGRILVEEKLAACVNTHPIKSIYRWEGKIEEDVETAMLVKTKSGLVDDIIRRVKELHSTSLPSTS